MRIGIDCRFYSSQFTGIGRYTHELVKNFIDINSKLSRPHQLVLFFNEPQYSLFKSDNPFVEKVLVNAPHYSFAEHTRFPKILNKSKIDLIHFPHFNVPLFLRTPYVVTIHDLTLTFYPSRKKTKFYHRLAYKATIKNAVKNARSIIAISNYTARDIAQQLKMTPKSINVIYNGVGREFKFLQKQTDVKKTLDHYGINKQFLLYTGVWRGHKNLPRLIEAFNILRKKHKLDLQLVLTGKPDPYYPEVKEAIEASPYKTDIITPGLVNETELLHLYNGSQFYVFPSLYEGFGLPPLEAMSCGTPVCASQASCIPEICGSNNALFFNPYNPVDIAEKIHHLYQNPALQGRLIENGIEHVKNFSWKKCAQDTWNILMQSTGNNH
jgi:glycosyltransferase involved in cell wall biosynthesis